MSFKGINAGIRTRLSSIRGHKSFYDAVVRVLDSVRPNVKHAIRSVEYESKKKVVTISILGKQAADQLKRNRDLVHAALRHEHMDVRKVVIRCL